MNKWYKVKFIEGRLFVLEFPYIGEDSVWIKKVVGAFSKPCKILAIAKEGTVERYYREEELIKIIDNDND